MAKKKTIIKKPVGNGNISITIENNLKNTNQVPTQVVAKKRRKRRLTEAVNLPPEPPGLLPPLKDVSYIKPGPSNNFTVWRDNFNDSYNTTIPQGQAQQMGLLRTLPTPALDQPAPLQHNITRSTGSTQTRPTGSIGSTQTEQIIFRAPRANYDPLGISDYDDTEDDSYLTVPSLSPSLSSTSSLDRRPENSTKELYRALLAGNRTGRGNIYNNLHYDPYNPNESMEDRFTERSFHTAQQEPDDEEEPAPINKTFAMDVYEEIAKENPGISIENAGKMLASTEDVTEKEVRDFYTGKQSIITTARGQGRKHGKSGSEIKGPYAKMPDYKNSYLVGKGEYDGKLSRFDQEYADEELYRNSFTKAKANFDKNIEKAVQNSENVTTRRGRSRTRNVTKGRGRSRPMAKTRIEDTEDTEDTEAGVNFDRQARIEDREKGLTMNRFSKDLFRDPKK